MYLIKSPIKIGKYTRWASCWDQYSLVSAIPEDCHLCTEISKQQTIIQATVLQELFLPEKQQQRTFIELKLTKIQFSPTTGKAHSFCRIQTKEARR